MSSRRLLVPSLAFGLAALSALVAAACLPWGVATRAASARVDRDLRAAYGVALAVGGSTAFTLLPWPRLTFHEVALAAEDRPLATSATLTVHLALLPLAAGRAEVTEIALDGARITLADRPGDERWSAPLRRLAAQAVAEPGGAAPLRRLTLRRSTLVGVDPRDGRPELAEDITLTAAWPRPGAPVEAWGSLAWHGRAVRFSLADIRPSDALNGAVTPFRASLAWPAGGLTLEGSGTFAGRPDLHGRARLDTAALGETLAWLGADVALAPLVGPLSVDAEFRSAEDGAVLPSLTVTAGRNALAGAGGLAVQEGRLAVTATLAADGLDLAPVLPPLRAALGESGWSTAAIRLDRFTGCDLDLRLSAGTAVLGALRFEDVAAGLQVKDGAIEATVGRASLREGVAKGRLALAASTEGIDLRASASLDGVDLGALLADLDAPRRVTGRLQGQLALEGAGAGMDALVRRLAGRATLTLRDGVLPGVDLAEVFERVETGRPAQPGQHRDGRTPFARADFALTFADGVGTVTEASLRAAALQARLAGRVSLPERALRARAELMPEGGRGAALFAVEGPWDAVTVRGAGLAPPGAEAAALPIPPPSALPGRALPARASAYAP